MLPRIWVRICFMSEPIWLVLTATEKDESGEIMDAYPELVGLGQVPFKYLNTFHLLHQQLAQLSSDNDLEDQLFFSVAQKILNLHPRVDSPGEWGFDLGWLDVKKFTSLFITQGPQQEEPDQEDAIAPSSRPGQLVELNSHSPIEDPYRELDNADRIDDASPWTSESPYLNQLSVLVKALNSFSEAESIMMSHGINEVDVLCKRLNELSLDQKELNKRRDKRDYWSLQRDDRYKDVFHSIYRGIAGGGEESNSQVL